MSERTFYVPRTVGPLQVELPEFKGSGRKGALHIRPSSTLFLSDDEATYLSEKESALFSKLMETTPKKKAVRTPSVSFGSRIEKALEDRTESGERASTGRKKKEKDFEY